MTLNITSTQEEFLPFVKYNAKAGRWYFSKDKVETELIDPTFVADFKNMKTGWFYLAKGTAPQKVIDPSLGVPAPKPTQTYVDEKGVTRDCFKRGFEVNIFSKNLFGGVALISGSSMHLKNAIVEMYTQYEASAEAKEGKLPVIQANGTTPMKDKHGTNYAPKLTILKYIDRPAELDAVPAQVTPAAATPQQAAPVKKVVNEF